MIPKRVYLLEEIFNFMPHAKSRARNVEYMLVESIQQWINSMKTSDPLSTQAIRDKELLGKLETFIHNLK